MTDKFENARFVSARDGRALLRNFPENKHKWRILNSTGKWQNGTEHAAQMLFKGEFGFADITHAEAQALAAKLGGSLGAAR